MVVEVEPQGGERRGGRGSMVASQLVLVNHFFLALVHNTPDPATAPDFNSVVVDAGCGRGCRLCSPINGCLACDPPFFLVLQRDGPRQTASCTKTCPKGFFKVKKKRNGFCSKCTMLGCDECLGPHYCFTCQQHYFNYFGRCIKEPTGKNRTQHLGLTTEPTLLTDDERRDEPEETTIENDDEGLTIMVTSPYKPTPTSTPNTTLSPITTPTLRPTPSPLPSVPSSATPSGRGRGHLRPCRRRRKHRHGRKNRNKGKQKDVINRRRQCRRRGKGRGRRKRRRERKRKTTTSQNKTSITNSTTITVTTVLPTTTQMIDLSLLGEEGQGGGTRFDAPTQLDSHKFFYNRAREMASYKQSSAYRRKKPARVSGKRLRHAKVG